MILEDLGSNHLDSFLAWSLPDEFNEEGAAPLTSGY